MPRVAHVARAVGFVLLCAAGALGGALVAGRTHAEVGPFHTTVTLRLSATGDTVVRLAPLGSLTLDTHDGPIGLTASADEVDVEAARRVVEDPTALDRLDDDAVRDGRAVLRTVLLRAFAGALLGAIAVAALRHPTRRSIAVAAVVGIVTSIATAGAARATWNENAVAEPRYTGLLTVAPRAIGSIERVQAQYEAYRTQLTALIGNVAELYNVAANLTSFEPDAGTVRVLHVSDLHLNPQAFDLIEQLVEQFKIDVVVDTGDINDWGTVVEAQFVQRIAEVRVPYVYVRGNHDSSATAAAVAAQPNAVVLDGEAREVAGIRFWGIGDPRFTPDKTEDIDISEERGIADAFAVEVARRLDRDAPVDVTLIHDPRSTVKLGGLTRLVLAGHTHRPASRELSESTLLLVEGSTGGAGLRALQREQPVPLSCSVLYFDKDAKVLAAFDRITVTGLGSAGVRIQRHIVRPPNGDGAAEAVLPATTTTAP